MKITSHTLQVLLTAFALLGTPAEAAQMTCKSGSGNLCFRIAGAEMQRINASPSFQKALQALAAKMNPKTVYIYQGFRTPAMQQRIADRLCGRGRSSCSGVASSRTSKHVVSTAADPMISGNVVRELCYAENQARVENLGPRSAAAVYGYGNGFTWGHIDDATGSNYTPKNCPRNAGLNGAQAQAPAPQVSAAPPTVQEPTPEAPHSPRVESYRRARPEIQKARATAPNTRYNIFGIPQDDSWMFVQQPGGA